MKYRCDECGEIFDEDDLVITYDVIRDEFHGNVGQFKIPEDSFSPCCRAGYEEVRSVTKRDDD